MSPELIVRGVCGQWGVTIDGTDAQFFSEVIKDGKIRWKKAFLAKWDEKHGFYSLGRIPDAELAALEALARSRSCERK